MPHLAPTQKFSELPIIPDSDYVEYTSLGDLSTVTIDEFGLIDPKEVEEFSGVSRFLEHITELAHNQDYAATIPDDISSAMVFSQQEPKLYLLLWHDGDYHWTLYDIKRESLIDVKEDQLLDLIRCTRDTPTALIDPNEIEVHAQLCKALWCRSRNIEPPDTVERICSLYLKPYEDDDQFIELLQGSRISN